MHLNPSLAIDPILLKIVFEDLNYSSIFLFSSALISTAVMQAALVCTVIWIRISMTNTTYFEIRKLEFHISSFFETRTRDPAILILSMTI